MGIGALFTYMKSMTKKEALTTLENMPEAEFQAFFNSLPTRTTMTIKAGMADWRVILPDWYIKTELKGGE